MNTNQRIATAIALGIFVATVLFAPWELSVTSTGTRFNLGTKFSPVWLAPQAADFQIQPAKNLMTQSLVIEWVALAVVYLAALKLLSAQRRSAPRSIKNESVAPVMRANFINSEEVSTVASPEAPVKKFTKTVVDRVLGIVVLGVISFFLIWMVDSGKSFVRGFGWKPFSSIEGEFTAEFPKKPEARQISGRMNDPRFQDAKMLMAERGRVVFGVAYSDMFDEVVSQFTTDEILDAARDGCISSAGGQLVGIEERISHQGFPGREFRFTTRGGEGIARAFVVRKRKYVVIVIGSGSRMSKETTRFLDSFNLSSR